MSEAVIEARSITAGYNKVPAIRDVSFAVEPGSVVSLLGPNGAGKTTTLLSLVGLVDVLDGQAWALGTAVKRRRANELARRGVLLVPDDRGIFYGLTVAEHFKLSGQRVGPGRLELVLERFPALKGLMDRKVGLLSGGEQQMLAIACALLAEPKVLLVDEMSLGLAPKIVQEMLPAIRALASEESIAVILVEQHVELALNVSDYALVLNHGRVVLEGTARELLQSRERLQAAYFGADEFGDTDNEVIPQ